MSAAAGAAGPTPQERLWAVDPSTPAIVLGKLARFPELHPLVREHPAAYPDLVAWIDAQPGAPEDSGDREGVGESASTRKSASTGRRPLVIAASVAAITLIGAGVMLGVVQPWAPTASSAEPVSGGAVGEVTPSPTATPTAVPAAPVEGTVVVSAGANVRAAPSTSAAIVGTYNANARVPITCYVRGDTITDALGTTDVWYAVGTGYVSGAILQASDPNAVVPC